MKAPTFSRWTIYFDTERWKDIRPEQLVKELLRPFYSFRNANNLYRWLCKDGVDRGGP